MRAWGRLLRLSLAPTAAADIAAGIVFGARGAWPSGSGPWLLIAASLAIYHGSLAVNDWVDRAHDARTRPGRPIPSGAIAPAAALAIGLGAIIAGLACAWLARAEVGAWMSAVAILALVYNTRGRGAWSGPLLLAGCRAGNLGAGFYFATDDARDPALVVMCALYGAYVFCLSRMGRMEDSEDGAPLGRRPSAWLIACALALACVALVPRWPPELVGRTLAAVAALWAASGLVRRAIDRRTWTRGLVEEAMGMTLRRLLVFTSSVALLAIGPRVAAPACVAAAILAGYPVSRWLRGVFPPS